MIRHVIVLAYTYMEYVKYSTFSFLAGKGERDFSVLTFKQIY